MKKLLSVLLITVFLIFSVMPMVVSAKESSAVIDKSPVDGASQVVFVVVMTIGLIGLPAYFWLNARRNRLLREYNENNVKDKEDTNNEDTTSE